LRQRRKWQRLELQQRRQRQRQQQQQQQQQLAAGRLMSRSSFAPRLANSGLATWSRRWGASELDASALAHD